MSDYHSLAASGLLACLLLSSACSSGTVPGTGSGGGVASGGIPGADGSAAGGSSPGAGGSASVGGSSNGGGTGGAVGPAGGSPATGGQPASTGGAGSGAVASASELVAGLTLGWNLGNSLDAPEGETAWGNPSVTPELFAAVAAAGFDAVRIPVTWSLHMGTGPDFVIEPAFLSRVEEVANFALSSGLVAIINLHHDGADGLAGVEWLTLNDAGGNVTEQNNLAVRARFTAVWTQIASHFQGFGPNLLFESMNEIHDGYDAPDPAYYDIMADLNQVFVDLVRQSGGNNAERVLVVPGYNTNIDYTLAGFVRPTDSVADRLILSVHYYDPWSYAGEGSTHVWGAASPGTDSWGQEDYVVTKYDELASSFVSQGLPMIVGEYGAIQQDGYDDYRRYYMEYVTKVMVDRGILPFYWDNGGPGTGADAFGLVSRSNYSSLHPEILEAMMRAATEDYELADIALPAP